MHTLLVLTAVLSSLPAAETPVTLRDATVAPARHKSLHLMDPHSYAPEDADVVVGRVATEALVGAALGVGGTVFGGALVDFKIESLASVIPPVAFLVMGSAVGVSLSGVLMDGRGNFGFALLGSVIGFTAPLLMGSVILASNQCSVSSASRCGAAAPIAISMLLLPTVGAIIGYEASSPRTVKSSRNRWNPVSPSPRVFPTLAPARQGLGATLGLTGTL